MALAKRAIIALIKKVIKLEEARLKAGHHAGLEKQVAELLEDAKGVVGDE